MVNAFSDSENKTDTTLCFQHLFALVPQPGTCACTSTSRLPVVPMVNGLSVLCIECLGHAHTL